jgi:hypothetical protein
VCGGRWLVSPARVVGVGLTCTHCDQCWRWAWSRRGGGMRVPRSMRSISGMVTGIRPVCRPAAAAPSAEATAARILLVVLDYLSAKISTAHLVVEDLSCCADSRRRLPAWPAPAATGPAGRCGRAWFATSVGRTRACAGRDTSRLTAAMMSKHTVPGRFESMPPRMHTSIAHDRTSRGRLTRLLRPRRARLAITRQVERTRAGCYRGP